MCQVSPLETTIKLTISNRTGWLYGRNFIVIKWIPQCTYWRESAHKNNLNCSQFYYTGSYMSIVNPGLLIYWLTPNNRFYFLCWGVIKHSFLIYWDYGHPRINIFVNISKQSPFIFSTRWMKKEKETHLCLCWILGI